VSMLSTAVGEDDRELGEPSAATSVSQSV
jgi:hypothetical protein